MTSKSKKQEAQNPLILRCHRIIDAFAKSNDERDFYLDRTEGFILYCNLDKSEEELAALEKEFTLNSSKYCMIPKLTFYETKKIMEGFVNEKVYDIDTKEKLLDIIQSKEARENFLEFIQDHHTEFDKWQQFYQERSRIRIIEWLRSNHFHFVFEEDLEMPSSMIEKLKSNLFEIKVSKEILSARKQLVPKAKSYYSNEALNPRPKRGRPPKQAVKQEIETQLARDIYLTVAPAARPFLFSPELSNGTFSNFSSKFDGDEDPLSQRRQAPGDDETTFSTLNTQLSALRSIASRWVVTEKSDEPRSKAQNDIDFDIDDKEENHHKLNNSSSAKKAVSKSTKSTAKPVTKAAANKSLSAKKPDAQKNDVSMKNAFSAKKAAPMKKVQHAKKAVSVKKEAPKAAPKKKSNMRSILKTKTKNK